MSTKNKDITIGSMPAYHAYPDTASADANGGAQAGAGQKHPGLILIHEIWGLDAHIKDVSNRFAAQGYSVLAPNLFHGQSFEGKIDPQLFADMQDPEKKDEVQKKMRALFAPLQAPEFAAKVMSELKACVDHLAADPHVSGDIAVLGFCFGGTYSFALAAADSRIKAAVPFYGQPLAAEKIPSLACPVLAFYGEQDKGLIDSLPALKENMKKDGKDFTAIVYPNTGHAFFNDQNKRMYNEPAATDAWQKTLAFLKENLTSSAAAK